MAHEIYAPSSSATWLECTYSARHAVPEAPKPLSTQEAADEGTRRHLSLDGYVRSGELPPEDAPEYEQIALAADFLRQLEPGEMQSEVKGALAPDCGGTTDVLNLHPYITTVLDAKFGKWDVDAYHNMQMLTYGAIHLPRTSATWFRLVIFQPNGLDEKPFKQWGATRAEVEAHRDRVLRAIADRSPPRPGPHCRWCNAFQQCPAMAHDATFTIAAMSRDPMTLTPDELVRLLRLVRGLNDNRDMYEEILTTKLKLGYAAEGAMLKPGRAFRSFNDAQQAAEFGWQNYGAKGVRPLTPAQLEKMGLAGKQYVAVAAHKPEGQLKAVY